MDNVIYKLTINDMVYIGSTKRGYDKRISEHLSRLENNGHGNPMMQNYYNKYGNISHELIEVVEDESILEEREDHWMNHYDSLAPNGLNLKTAERQLLSEATKQKMSESKMGELNPFYGKSHSEEFKREQRENNQGGWDYLTDEQRAKHAKWIEENGSPFKGRTHTQEVIEYLRDINTGKTLSEDTKEKISAKCKGRVVSDEAKKAIGRAHKGKKLSAETRAKISASRKALFARRRAEKLRASTEEDTK